MIIGFVIALGWIWGIKALFTRPFLLYKIGEHLENSLHPYLYKPTIGCPVCMSSFHGTLIYALFVNQGIWPWPIFCIALCGFNFLIEEYVYSE